MLVKINAIVICLVLLGGCSTFKKSPEKAAAENRRASLAQPCAKESNSAEARIAEMMSQSNPAVDLDWTWQCKTGGGAVWFIKFFKKDGAELSAKEDVVGGGEILWSGAADGDQIVMLKSTTVHDEKEKLVDAKTVMRLSKNGQVLNGTLQRSIGFPTRYYTQPHERSWTCEEVEVTCTR